MSTLQAVELGVLGPLQVRQDGAPVPIPGAKPRAILTMLGLHGGSVVAAETLIELLWGDDPPRTAAKALQTHISALRRTLGDGFVLTEGMGWILSTTEVDASRYKLAIKRGRDATAAGDTGQAVVRFEEALTLWRGIPELPDSHRGLSEKTRWIESHAALVEDRADALLATGRAAEIAGELEAAVADAPLRERRWGQLMLALYRAGRQGEALAAYQRARSLLADELGVDPGPELRRLEAAIVAQDAALDTPVAQQLPSVMRAVTFLLTDIEGSTAAWEADADAMAAALARHDELVEQVVTSRGGRLIKTRGEGDATFSVFERPSAAAAAAIELQDAISHEPWALREPMRIRVALHTGEVELRDGDYFGRAVNRAARLRSLAMGGQILCSGATAELVIDSLPDDVMLADLGMRQLRNLARPEHVFELRLETAEPPEETSETPIERPQLPAILTGPGPFVGRGHELERLLSAWQTALTGSTRAVLIAGEPGVGKTRLAGEWSRQAYQQGAVVLYGRCDEDLGAPYQPFAEALRSLMPCLGASRLRGLRGVEALLPLAPGLTEVVPDLAAPTRADPDTERYALFDAVVALLQLASTSAPVVLILDDLHWAAKPTLLLLRHLLRFGDQARVQIVGTYRSTDLDRSHPLAAMLADLHRDGTANRLQLSGLDEDDVSAYVAEAGYDDEELARALASVTGGNPFFLIEALRHVDESGGVWDPSTLPQGVREAVSRRLSRLPAETNKALAAAAVIGSRFALDLVERVVDQDLVDAFDEACKAGIVIEEPGGRYRFNHAIVRQSLLAELASVRRMRLHQRIATTLENEPGADDELLAELAHHYFECAWAGNAAKAVLYCRRAADQAMARLGYEGAADLYDHALHALEEIDEELPDRDEQTAELLIARCEALLAAGDVASAASAVTQLQETTVDSARLAAWATCFDGQLSMLIHPERLDEVATAVGAAATKLAELGDAAGEAQAHTVRAGCLARLGRVGDCEIALDEALTAARRAREHRRVNAVLAGAPLAALWGPNPVPRAGGRCLDVVRLLRITTDSPAVEATSTRCQAVLEAFRGRAEAARRMIDSARRTVTELGLRHALLEVEQFAGIVELVVDDPAAAEPYLRKAYNGFRRMGLDADTAETAALLGRACLALGQDVEADELCSQSERLAGHALKASISWRTLRAQLLSRRGDHDEARRVAEAAVALAERTDALVDHGDACLTLATVLGAAGDAAGVRAAADRAVDLYERKGAAALAERARLLLGERVPPTAPAPSEPSSVEFDNAAVRTGERLKAAIDRRDWDEFEQLFAPDGSVESRRKIVGFKQTEFAAAEVMHQTRVELETGTLRLSGVVIAVRGERLALHRVALTTDDVSRGAPRDEFLQLYGIDDQGRIALQVWFDLEDMDAALAELDAIHARSDEVRPRAPLANAATRIYERLHAYFADRDWDAITALLNKDYYGDDRRSVVGVGIRVGPDAAIEDYRSAADIDVTDAISDAVATRGACLALTRARYSRSGQEAEAFRVDFLQIVEIDTDEQITALVAFDLDDFDAAIAELDARYLAGEAADHAHTWSIIAGAYYAAMSRHEMPPTTPNFVNIDHRRGTPFAYSDLTAAIRAFWDLTPECRTHIGAVHRLSNRGAVVTQATSGTSQEGFDAGWREISLVTVEGDLVNRAEVFDEADLDAALTRFEQLSRPAGRPESALSRAAERFSSCYAARDWDAMAKLLAEDLIVDDRRRGVNAGIQQGRDAEIEDLRRSAEVGFTNMTSVVIATRERRLSLNHFSTHDQRPEEFGAEALHVVEFDAEGRIAALVIFDLEDFDAAFEELDARYLAGEAAPYARTWSAITQAYNAISRRELPLTTPDCANIDHRQARAFAPGEMIPYIHATPQSRIYIEAVHRLSNRGAVVTNAMNASSQEDFDTEWREVFLLTFQGDLLSRCELFDEADLDAALARVDELSRPARQPENAASRVDKRFQTCFANRDWDAMAEMLSDGTSIDDRRRVVNAGNLHGRDAELTVHAYAAVGSQNVTATVTATRGQHLALSHYRFSGLDQRHDAFSIEILAVVEIDTDERMAAVVVLDPDDLDAAFAELDARYLAGEAADHGHAWSLVAGSYAALNRHELPLTTPDCVNLDHRREAAFGPGDLTAYIQAGWDFEQDINIYVEQVHRLTDIGAVVTYAAHETSHEGLMAEWRGIAVFTVDGELINRTEVYGEADLDAALAKFEQLSRPALRLENTASQTYERVKVCFAARDWDALAEIVANDVSTEDRRRVVNAGPRRGRQAVIAEVSGLVEVIKAVSTEPIATRGERLVACRGRAEGYEAFRSDLLDVVEVDADGRLLARIVFDPDDFDAAFAELDARYLSGEAAAHAHTWSVVTKGYAAFNRHEFTAPHWENIDHRRARAFAPGELTAYMDATWNLAPNVRVYVETVHRLTKLGAVVTHVVRGTSREGFDAEWREVILFTIDGDLFNRCEVFDETDLDAALARFEELHQQAPRLENAASQVDQRFWTSYAARDWDAIAELLADDVSTNDRRRVVNAGVLSGRDVHVQSMRALAELEANMTSTVIATRGERLALTHLNRDLRDGEFGSEALYLSEIDADHRITAGVFLELDDLDAAFDELDARYAAGEAAANARTWAVLTRAYAVLNARGLPATTPEWVNIDHRRGATFAPGEMTAYISAAWADLEQDLCVHIEAVHRLSKLGAVLTQVLKGTTQEGFEAEWRTINLFGVDGELINRCELFAEADLEAALARFDELTPRAPQLQNAASQANDRYVAYFRARNWAAITEILTDDSFVDDRRRMTGAGFWDGRDVVIANLRALADAAPMPPTAIATRGARLALTRISSPTRDLRQGEFSSDMLIIAEIDTDERITAQLAFDLDDVDAAFAELDRRYLAGEAAAHAHTWSVIAGIPAAFIRHELFATTPDHVYIDHRPLVSSEGLDVAASMRAVWDITSACSGYFEAVHRLSELGAVFTLVLKMTTQEGFDAELRMIELLTVEGDLISRVEVFDEADLDAALAHFEELHPQAPRLENAASQVVERFQRCFAARDWDAMPQLLAEDSFTDDRRPVVGVGIRRGREVIIADWRAVADVGTKNVTLTVIATRGDDLALGRFRFAGRDPRTEAFRTDVLGVVEINAENQIAACLMFDLDDIDSAFHELDTRYIAGEAAAHSHTWSVIARSYYKTNRRELPGMTPDSVFIDRRAVLTTEPEPLAGYLRGLWELMPDISVYIESVHRLSDLGAVITQAARGTSQEGFDAEWRAIVVGIIEGDLYSRVEAFDEADLDAVLARFDELRTPARPLENAASRANHRLFAYSAVHNWAAIAQILADDSFVDDRRRVVNVGFWDGRETVMANMRALAEGLANVTLNVIATREERLTLARIHSWNGGPRDGEFGVEMLGIVEIDAAERIAGYVFFEPDDIDAAFEELDRRYLAGEAAPHSRTWSVVTRDYAAINRHEVPTTTPDWVNIDHRRGIAFAPGEFPQYLRATFDVSPDIKIYIEAIHRLSDLGIVFTHAAYGTSQEGFDAEWRETAILTIAGDLVNRCEMFDDSDVDAALARFADLDPSDKVASPPVG